MTRYLWFVLLGCAPPQSEATAPSAAEITAPPSPSARLCLSTRGAPSPSACTDTRACPNVRDDEVEVHDDGGVVVANREAIRACFDDAVAKNVNLVQARLVARLKIEKGSWCGVASVVTDSTGDAALRDCLLTALETTPVDITSSDRALTLDVAFTKSR